MGFSVKPRVHENHENKNKPTDAGKIQEKKKNETMLKMPHTKMQVFDAGWIFFNVPQNSEYVGRRNSDFLAILAPRSQCPEDEMKAS